MKVNERILHIVRLFQCRFYNYSKIKVFIVISSSPYILFQCQSAPKYSAPNNRSQKVPDHQKLGLHQQVVIYVLAQRWVKFLLSKRQLPKKAINACLETKMSRFSILKSLSFLMRCPPSPPPPYYK